MAIRHVRSFTTRSRLLSARSNSSASRHKRLINPSSQPAKPRSLPQSQNSAINAVRQRIAEEEAANQAIKARKLPVLWLSAAALFAAALSYSFVSFYLLATRTPCTKEHEHVDLNAVYDTAAPTFDADTDATEWWTGISRLRRKLLTRAEGAVLESAVGTGRNLRYYSASDVERLTCVDNNATMLDICKKKWEDGVMAGKGWRSKVGFATADLAGPEDTIAASQEGKFDTVVQTFAVCSTDEPERLLRNLGKLVKEDGQILLLEHGKGHYDWLNRALDTSALAHARKFGCWWNRDIGAIVDRSGLEVVEAKRFTLGTTWWFILRPKRVVEPQE